ncbi:hypothetical protein [Rahnella aceris]
MSEDDKNKLPARKYYPIKDAAEKLKCSVNDILHFASVGILDLCIYLDFKCEVNDKRVHLNIPFEKINQIDDLYQTLSGEKWNVGNLEFLLSEGSNGGISGYYAGRLFGFFYVPSTEALRAEFVQSEEVKLTYISTNPEGYDGDDVEINFLKDDGEVFTKNSLCLMASEMEKINSTDTGNFPKQKEREPETDKTIAKKAELIPALLRMIPELSDVDFEKTPINKIVELIEATAATKQIAIPNTHRQTWQKYLGRK